MENRVFFADRTAEEYQAGKERVASADVMLSQTIRKEKRGGGYGELEADIIDASVNRYIEERGMSTEGTAMQQGEDYVTEEITIQNI